MLGTTCEKLTTRNRSWNAADKRTATIKGKQETTQTENVEINKWLRQKTLFSSRVRRSSVRVSNVDVKEPETRRLLLPFKRTLVTCTYTHRQTNSILNHPHLFAPNTSRLLMLLHTGACTGKHKKTTPKKEERINFVHLNIYTKKESLKLQFQW